MSTTLRPTPRPDRALSSILFAARLPAAAFFRRLALAGTAALLIAVVPSGVMAQGFYVANYNNNTVSQYDASTGAPVKVPFLASGLSRPIGLTASGNTLYVANSTGGTVNAYNAATGAAASGFTTITPGSNPFDVLASGNRLYVSSRAGNAVRAYDALTGSPAADFPTITTDLNSPTGLALSDGVLYVANRGALTIRTYDAQTGALLNPSFLTGVNTQFLTVAGNVLYLSQSSGVNTVTAYDLSTRAPLAGFTTITGLGAPQGLQVVGGNLFVSNFSTNSVREYDAATGALVNAGFITGLSGPYGLALVAVPEPSTWVLLGAGSLALLVRALRRRAGAPV